MARPFSFGDNWQSFLRSADAAAFAGARGDIGRWLPPDWLPGRTVLDIGCGSGIHAAGMLDLGAASVVSMDVDPASVAAASSLRERAGGPANWTVRHGSVLDGRFMSELGLFDLVYSWGVLHHTGAMWAALDQAVLRVAPEGLLWVSLYTAGPGYARDLAIKQRYNRSGRMVRWLLERREIAREMRALLRARRNPFAWNRRKERGMDVRHDILDWLGGLPYEVAGVDEMVRWGRGRGLVLERVDPQPEGSCTGYVFRRGAAAMGSIKQ